MGGLFGRRKSAKQAKTPDSPTKNPAPLQRSVSVGETLHPQDQFTLQLVTPNSSRANFESVVSVFSGSTLPFKHASSDSTVSSLTTQSTMSSNGSSSERSTSSVVSWGATACCSSNTGGEEHGISSYLKDDTESFLVSCCAEKRKEDVTKHSLEATTAVLEDVRRLEKLRSDTSLFDGLGEDSPEGKRIGSEKEAGRRSRKNKLRNAGKRGVFGGIGRGGDA